MIEQAEKIGVVDTHFHLWDLQRWHYQWPTAAEKRIFRNFDISDYENERKATPIQAGIFVEAHNSINETRWAIKTLSSRNSVQGIVGFAHTEDPDLLDKELQEFTKQKKFVGVRNIIQREAAGWLRLPGVLEGMKVLKKYNLTFDLLVKKENFKDAIYVVRNSPGNKFVIDHLAKPNAKTGETKHWYEGMSALGSFDNVYCKLSGMVTEADLDSWKSDDFKDHVQHVMHIFGAERVMFGSDWPVCKMANANLSTVYDLLDQLTHDFTDEKKKIFETNAIDFYNLRL